MNRHLQGAMVGATSFVAILMISPRAADAQQLSVRHYDVRDGLVHSRVIGIYQDAKGYLWFATWEGLSRFDGYQFTNYDTRDGLGNTVVNSVTEDHDGILWVATNGGGVSRLIDDPSQNLSSASIAEKTRRKFLSFGVGDSAGSNRVNAMLFDSEGNFWCATDSGLYRAPHTQAGAPKFEVVVPHTEVAQQMSAFADSRGRLWFGVSEALIEIVEGKIIKYGAADKVGDPISTVEDKERRIVTITSEGVFEFIETSDVNARGRWRKLPVAWQPDQAISDMIADSNGALWIATAKGLIKHKDSQRLYTVANGLSGDRVTRLREDRDGNLWVGTWSSGVCKISGEMIVSFTRSEGLPDQDIVNVVEDHHGRIYASTYQGGLVEITNGRAEPVMESRSPRFRYINGRILQDHRDDWWIGTSDGLYWIRGPDLNLQRCEKVAAVDGSIDSDIHCIYEDRSGRVWVSGGDRDLLYLDPARTARAHLERAFATTPLPVQVGQTRLVRDPSGALWLFGWLSGTFQLARLKDGIVSSFQPIDRTPGVNPRVLFVDSRGWLWVGDRSSGVLMTKDSTAQSPQWVNYSTANGMASDTVYSITEDDRGRVYFGTFKGLDRLDPSTGEIDHFTSSDGLAGDLISHCMKDHQGYIWVSTSTGLSRLNPSAERQWKAAPAVYVSRVRIAGEDLQLPETGAVHARGPEVSSSRNNLLIEFVGLDFEGEQEIKYRYKLEGADADWSSPSSQRSVNYARLGPGSYRFWVKAINREGLESPDPAMLEFRIMPPLWQRWWFLTTAAVLAAAAIYSVYRVRLARLVEIERVRTRIASDLHDDIGSNLSKIAILSEVARQQVDGAESKIRQPLSAIARISRESVASMSDVVWAINPGKDSLKDLTRRMRAFASDTFTARNVAFEFHAPPSDIALKLGADLRRTVFLIFKEAINNTVRHSSCRKAVIELRIDRHCLAMTVSDDGKGFDPTAMTEGNGVLNMKKRAAQVAGELTVISSPGSGTAMLLRIPVHQGALALTREKLRRSGKSTRR